MLQRLKEIYGQIKDFGVGFIVLRREMEQLDGRHPHPHTGKILSEGRVPFDEITLGQKLEFALGFVVDHRTDMIQHINGGTKRTGFAPGPLRQYRDFSMISSEQRRDQARFTVLHCPEDKRLRGQNHGFLRTSAIPISYGGRSTPLSVMIAVMSSCGVTSNAGA
jgi:hypothetical protein